MSNIQKWGHIIRAFDETSRSKIVLSMFSIKKIKNNRYYWVLLSVYVFVSACALMFYQSYFFYSVLAVCTTALCLFPLLERKLSDDLKNVYEPHGLNDHPILMRTRYLHFIKFKERLISEKIVKPTDIKALLHWDEIKNEKVDMTSFFQSKIFLIFLTGIVGLIIKLITGANLKVNELTLLIYLAIVFVWIFWAIFDFSQLPHRRRIDLNRFLKWYELDSEAEE